MANWLRQCLNTPPNNPSCFDRFVTGHFWWKWKLHRAEKSLAKALDEVGSNPINLRHADLEFEKVEFADIYGKPTNPQIRAVVKTAHKAGASLIDLWTLIINNVLQCDKEGRVFVRRAPLILPLTWSMRISILLQIFRFSFLFFSSSESLWVKIFSETFSMIFFGACLLYFDIYTSRYEKAVNRTETLIEKISDRLNRLSTKNNVVQLVR